MSYRQKPLSEKELVYARLLDIKIHIAKARGLLNDLNCGFDLPEECTHAEKLLGEAIYRIENTINETERDNHTP